MTTVLQSQREQALAYAGRHRAVRTLTLNAARRRRDAIRPEQVVAALDREIRFYRTLISSADHKVLTDVCRRLRGDS